MNVKEKYTEKPAFGISHLAYIQCGGPYWVLPTLQILNKKTQQLITSQSELGITKFCIFGPLLLKNPISPILIFLFLSEIQSRSYNTSFSS